MVGSRALQGSGCQQNCSATVRRQLGRAAREQIKLGSTGGFLAADRAVQASMLDTYWGRSESLVGGVLDRMARACVRREIAANWLTGLALGSGLVAAALFWRQQFAAGWVLLVVSGVLDAVDGRVARLGKGVTPWGGVLDLVFDRMVEGAVLLALSLPRPDVQPAALFLLATWYVNITVFLAVGAASRHPSGKLIAYPPGLLERSEALLFCTLALLLPRWLAPLCIVYGLLGLVTAAQRLWHGYRALQSVAGGAPQP